MKTCACCHIEKPLSSFGKSSHYKSGINNRCFECCRKAKNASAKKYYIPHPKKRASEELYRTKKKEYYAKNKEKILARSIAWQKANPDKTNEKNRLWLERNPDKTAQYYLAAKTKNPHRLAELRKAWSAAHPWIKAESVAARRARKKNATPKWANPFFMREAYHLARLRTAATGFKWEVDHFYPLQSKAVCGLHVEHNLQVIPKFVNQQKSNKVTYYA
jgi:hypothetical protein